MHQHFFACITHRLLKVILLSILSISLAHALPTFSKKNNINNLDLAVDSYSAPILSDLDADGDVDLLVGDVNGDIYWFKNTGNPTTPIFSLTNKTLLDAKGDALTTLTLGDLDADGDLDLLVGDSNGNLHWFDNDGNAVTPNFIKRAEADNPLQTIYLNRDVQSKRSAPILGDLDSDGDLDLLVGELEGNLRWFENSGDVVTPLFSERIGADNPFNQINVGERSKPFLADLDLDGDLDLLVGEREGGLRWFENVSTPDEFIFNELSGTDNPLHEVNVNEDSTPTLADLDADGDFDLVIGDKSGSLHWFENHHATNQPSFKERHSINNPLSRANITTGFSAPTLADLDADGDFDLVVGKYQKSLSPESGNEINSLYWFENTGKPTLPVFTEHTGTTNPLHQLNLGDFRAPTFGDLDADGDFDLLVGIGGHSDDSGTLHWFENSGDAFKPTFEERYDANNPLHNIDVGVSSTPALADLDADGDVDLLIGELDGDLHWFENVGSAFAPQFIERTGADNPLSTVDVGEDSSPVLGDLDLDGDIDLLVGTKKGTLRWFVNNGSVNAPLFVELTGVDNPLHSVCVGEQESAISDTSSIASDCVGGWSKPALADLDADGDLDVLVGNQAGQVRWFENTTQRPFPSVYALPAQGVYSSCRLITLNCLDCTSLVYRVGDGVQQTYDKPFWLEDSGMVSYAKLNAQGQVGTWFSTYYHIDNQPPSVAFDDLKEGHLVADSLPIIKGIVEDTDGSGIQRLELQLSNVPYYLEVEGDGLALTPKLTWLPIESDFLQHRKEAVPAIKWQYPNLEEQIFPSGTYTLTVRAVDFAGRAGEKTIKIHKVNQARAELSLEFKPAINAGKKLTLQGRLISRRYPPLEENLLDKSLELYFWSEDCEAPYYDELGVWQLPSCEKGTSKTGYWSVPIASDIGQFFYETPSLEEYEGKYFLQARFPGDELLTSTESLAKPILIDQSAGYAVLLQGRAWIEKEYEGLAAHNKTLNRIYRILLARGLAKDNIRYFSFIQYQDVDGNGDLTDDIYSYPKIRKLNFEDEQDGLEETFLTWLPSRMQTPAPLYVILVDHGDSNGNFYIDQNQHEHTKLKPADLSGWLANLENNPLLSAEVLAEPRIVVLGSCFSGKALASNTGLELAGRIVITSAAAEEESYKGPLEEDGVRGGEYFVESLFHELGLGENLGDAFILAQTLTRSYTRRDTANSTGIARTALQNPQLNVHGVDYTEQPNRDDLSFPLGIGIERVTNYAGSPADLCSAPPAVMLPANEFNEFTLTYPVNDARRVQNARLEVRRPDIELIGPSRSTGPAQQREITDFYRVVRDAQCSQVNHTCHHAIEVATLFQQNHLDAPEVNAFNVFDQVGRYELQYFLTDSETRGISPLHRSFVYKAAQSVCEFEGQTDCNSPPDAFQLDFPVNAAVTQKTVSFLWQASHDDDGWSYTLTIATDVDFNNVVYQRQDLIESRAEVDVYTVLADCSQGLVDGETYYWKVEAVDYFGAVTPANAVFSFKVDNKNGVGCSDSGCLVFSPIKFNDGSCVSAYVKPRQIQGQLLLELEGTVPSKLCALDLTSKRCLGDAAGTFDGQKVNIVCGEPILQGDWVFHSMTSNGLRQRFGKVSGH